MKRRQFLTLGATAGVGASLLRSSTSASAQSPKWRPDGLSSIGRFGVLTPDFDPVPESEMSAMAPRGVSIHGARVPRQEGGARAFADPPHVHDAVRQLVALAPRAILFAYTSSSYALGVAAESAVRARLEKRAQGIPVLFTCQAATLGLRELGARRVAIISPPWFSEDVNAQGRSYFESQGFDVLACTRLAPSRSFAEVAPAEVFEWTRRHVPERAEAVFIGGNGMRSVGAIHALEETLRKPVLTANQGLLWQALRLVGASAKVTQYGRIFGEGPPATAGGAS